MATRVDGLLRKLNACVADLPEEISPHFLKMSEVFGQALPRLSGDIELERESNVELEKVISDILDVVQVVEYIIDLYSSKGPSIFTTKSEIYSKMRGFLHKDPCSEKVLPFALGLVSGVIGQFTGPSFLDMLKKFSVQVCSRVERLLCQIDLML